MKFRKFSLLPLALAGTLLFGCGEQKAEKEYTQILDKEMAGGDPKMFIDQYQAFVSKYPDTKAATRARERLVALKSKVEEEVKQAQLKAEQEERQRQAKAEQAENERLAKVEQAEKERQAKAEQEAKERLEQERVQQAYEAERQRQLTLLQTEMADAAKAKASDAHPNRIFVEILPYRDGKIINGDDGKSWTVQQSYQIRQKGTILGTSYSMIIDCTGVLVYDSYNKHFAPRKITKVVAKEE